MKVFIITEKSFENSQIRSYFEKLPFKEHNKDARLDFYNAESGKLGIERIEAEAKKENQFDLVVISQKMKALSGLQTAQMLAQKKALKVPPIILLTDLLDKNMVAAGAKAGIHGYLRIPYNLDTFKDALTSMVTKMVEKTEQKRADLIALAQKKGETTNIQEFTDGLNKRTIGELEQYVQYAPWNNKPHLAMARLLMESGDYKTSIPLLRTSIKIDFTDREPHRLLQECYRKTGMHKEELGSLKRLLADNPKSAEINLKVGDALLKEGDLAKAAEFFKRAIQNHKPEDNRRVKARSHMGLGQTMEKLGANDKQAQEEAKNQYSHAVTVDPTLVCAYFNLIGAYKKLGMEDQAKEVMKQAVRISPEGPQDWLDLFFFYIEEGDVVKAKFVLNKSLAMEEGNPATYFSVGEAFLHQRMFEDAAVYFEKAVDLYPSDIRSYNCLGICYRNLNNIEKAIEHYQSALKIDPDDFNVHFNLGKAFTLAKETEKAKACFEAALKLNPELSEAKSAIASLAK